jgi:phosphate transport system permease protein
MQPFWLFISVLALAALGFVLGRLRALRASGGDRRRLHSLPGYYGWNVALFTLVPGVLLIGLWITLQPPVISKLVGSALPQTLYENQGQLNLVMSDVRRIAAGLDAMAASGAMTEGEIAALDAGKRDIKALLGEAGVAVGGEIGADILQAAQQLRALSGKGRWLLTFLTTGTALVLFLWSLHRITPGLRARVIVEQFVLALLVAAASLAVLTTFGIVLSLLFNAIEFLDLHPALDFFFGLTWSPSFGGGSQLGIVPLLWGTLYISVIALAVAVPIGLFAAVYLSEYSGAKTRAIVKPLLEVLAGIPTIVYGLFALLTVGPMLLVVFGREGLGWMQGGTAVMTAGLVMGVMLIPFVSSLSDDIINAVPQALRDGSYALGATRSETVRQVILPAALPGIVGAVLLAASRAIGETMIVVLGAGAAARLSLNPFEAMTTVTAKIVSQLTGDADFASAEALVAFALGMALFLITLGLNILALYIVRKYREQYE